MKKMIVVVVVVRDGVSDRVSSQAADPDHVRFPSTYPPPRSLPSTRSRFSPEFSHNDGSEAGGGSGGDGSGGGARTTHTNGARRAELKHTIQGRRSRDRWKDGWMNRWMDGWMETETYCVLWGDG